MPKFLLLTTAGTLLWTLLLAWIGTILGQNYDQIAPYLDAISWTVAILLVGSILWWILKQHRSKSTK